MQPRIDFEGDPPQVVHDDNGIARGGIRLPQVEVPMAHNSAIQQSPDVFSRLVGFHEAFPVEKVRALYGDRDTYLDRYAQGDPGGRERRRSSSPATSTPFSPRR